jgi:hypothetical protein
MDDIDRFLEDEEEDALLDQQPNVLEFPEDSDALAAEVVDEATWVRPALPEVQAEKDTIGTACSMRVVIAFDSSHIACPLRHLCSTKQCGKHFCIERLEQSNTEWYALSTSA